MSQTFVGDQSDKLSLDQQTNFLSRTTNPHPGQKRDDTEKVDFQIQANFTSEWVCKIGRNEEIELIKSNFSASQTKMWWDKVWKLDFPASGNFTILWVWKIGLKGGFFDEDIGIIKDI